MNTLEKKKNSYRAISATVILILTIYYQVRKYVWSFKKEKD